jgi:hypothetical protein
MTPEAAFAATFTLLVALWLLNVVSYASLLRMLRLSYPEQWKEVGSPTLIMNNSIRNSLALQRFIWGRGAKLVGDQELCRSVRTIKILEAVFLLVFILAVVAFFWYL